jgi:hypothetical protein
MIHTAAGAFSPDNDVGTQMSVLTKSTTSENAAAGLPAG